jgi:hypothetical protein
MKHTILDPDYETVFVDHTEYPPSTAFQLRGLAAAIQDSHDSWRPKLSELTGLLEKMQDWRRLVAAGASYGAGKQIMQVYEGPAILLFGAALNAVGKMPDVELSAALASATETLGEAGVLDRPDVAATIEAARQRAQFDKVSAMLRAEFETGLLRSGRYSREQIDRLVPQIVKATHDTRHRAIIGRWAWAATSFENGAYVADPSTLSQAGEHRAFFYRKPAGDTMMFGASLLAPLVTAAQVGCAFALLQRVETAREPQ